LSLYYAMKVYGELRLVPHIQNPDSSRKCGDNLTLRLLHPRDKSARYLLNRGLCGPHSRSGRFEHDEKNAVGVILV
jgi:hypothetical protein